MRSQTLITVRLCVLLLTLQALYAQIGPKLLVTFYKSPKLKWLCSMLTYREIGIEQGTDDLWSVVHLSVWYLRDWVEGSETRSLKCSINSSYRSSSPLCSGRMQTNLDGKKRFRWWQINIFVLPWMKIQEETSHATVTLPLRGQLQKHLHPALPVKVFYVHYVTCWMAITINK